MWKGIGTKWSLMSFQLKPFCDCWYRLWLTVWPSTCRVWWEHRAHHAALKTWMGSKSCVCLAGLEATGKGAAFIQYLNHQGMALLFFLAFTGTFFLCKITQVPKLLKENELFSKHTLFNLLVKWLLGSHSAQWKQTKTIHLRWVFWEVEATTMALHLALQRKGKGLVYCKRRIFLLGCLLAHSSPGTPVMNSNSSLVPRASRCRYDARSNMHEPVKKSVQELPPVARFAPVLGREIFRSSVP